LDHAFGLQAQCNATELTFCQLHLATQPSRITHDEVIISAAEYRTLSNLTRPSSTTHHLDTIIAYSREPICAPTIHTRDSARTRWPVAPRTPYQEQHIELSFSANWCSPPQYPLPRLHLRPAPRRRLTLNNRRRNRRDNRGPPDFPRQRMEQQRTEVRLGEGKACHRDPTDGKEGFLHGERWL